MKNEDDIIKKNKKNLFLIPLKFRGKPFLGLAQLSKIFYYLLFASRQIRKETTPKYTFAIGSESIKQFQKGKDSLYSGLGL